MKANAPRPARTFHTLPASEATPCLGSLPVFATLRDVRAKFKTAWRFCFSPHDPHGPGSSPGERRRAQTQHLEEWEKCGLVDRRQFVTGVLAAPVLAALGRAANAARWQIGCYTRPWAEHEPRVALDGIAAAGYRLAGLMTAKGGTIVTPATKPDQVAALGAEAKSRGLAIASIYGGDFLVPKSPADSVKRLRQLIDHSALCGCPSLLLGGTGKAELVDPYYQTVTECCDYAAAKGVGLTVKPHGGTNSTGPECRRLLAKVGHKNFRLWYDPGNIFFYSEGRLNPVDDAATVDGLVVGMSVKDFRPPKDVNVTPGTGQVDFSRVLALLRRGGFTQGPLIVECLERGDLAHITAEARRARIFLEGITR